jgi:hypothetical protein
MGCPRAKDPCNSRRRCAPFLRRRGPRVRRLAANGGRSHSPPGEPRHRARRNAARGSRAARVQRQRIRAVTGYGIPKARGRGDGARHASGHRDVQCDRRRLHDSASGRALGGRTCGDSSKVVDVRGLEHIRGAGDDNPVAQSDPGAAARRGGEVAAGDRPRSPEPRQKTGTPQGRCHEADLTHQNHITA